MTASTRVGGGTAVSPPGVVPATGAVSPPSARQAHRYELAALLDRDADDLPDGARLREDLALDSLAMMRVFAWLTGHGVRVDAGPYDVTRVGEVLSLLDRAKAAGVSIQITGSGANPAVATAVATAAVDLPGARRSPLVPVLQTGAFRLSPIEDADLNFLYGISVQPETSFRWRYRGAPPSFDRFAADLWASVLVQFVARHRTEDRQVGHVVAYGADANQRYAYVAAVFLPEYAGSGMAAEVVAVFVRYLFHTFPFVKLYLEVPGYNWAQLASGEGKLFEVEGVLRDHDYYAGRTWDKYLCAIYPPKD